MSRAGALGHTVLGTAGTAMLLALSEPIAWHEPRVPTDQWDLVAVVVGIAVVVTGVIAGALDGTLLHTRSTAGLVVALLLDAVLLAPLLWVSGLVMLFLQSDDGGAPLDAVLAPVGGWLAGVLLLHLVSCAVVGLLDRDGGGEPPAPAEDRQRSGQQGGSDPCRSRSHRSRRATLPPPAHWTDDRSAPPRGGGRARPAGGGALPAGRRS